MSLLLIQSRAPEDPLTEHECQCIARRVEHADIQIAVRNAIEEPAEPGWLASADAVVIGGSGTFSVNHPLSEAWVAPLRRLMDVILERATPTFGICFGHQLLGLHLGSKVETHRDLEEAGTVSLQRTPAGDVCELFSSLPPLFSAHTGHSDHVLSLPTGVDLLASGDQVPMQAFGVRGLPVFSTQFHPDLTGAEARQRYLAVYSSKQHASAEEVEAGAAAFRIDDHDHAAGLLGRFVDLYAG